LSERFDDAALAEFRRLPAERPAEADQQAAERGFANAEFAERIGQFFAAEGVRAVMVPSGNNPQGGASGGTIYADWNANLGMFAYQKAHAMRVPLVIIADEEYLRLTRLLERKVPVTVQMNVDVEFTGDRVEGVNVLADILSLEARASDRPRRRCACCARSRGRSRCRR
jgi:hypothetical protein